MMYIQSKQQEEQMQQQQAAGGAPGQPGQPVAEGQPPQEGQAQGEGELPEFTEQDSKLLQQYGVGSKEEKEAVEKAIPYLMRSKDFQRMLKSMKPKPVEYQLIIED